jgi:hypothetical protein
MLFIGETPAVPDDVAAVAHADAPARTRASDSFSNGAGRIMGAIVEWVVMAQ